MVNEQAYADRRAAQFTFLVDIGGVMPKPTSDPSLYLSRVGNVKKPVKEPDRPPPKKPKLPKGKSGKNPWANPKFRKVVGLIMVMDMAKYVRELEFHEDRELGWKLNEYADKLREEVMKLEKQLTREELAELDRINPPEPDQAGRHPIRPKF
jgi:hypothetical protein